MSNRSSLYSLEDGKLVRKNETCPKCGPGVFMANHSNRKSCGRCGFNVDQPAPPTEDESTVPEVAVEGTPEAEVASEEE